MQLGFVARFAQLQQIAEAPASLTDRLFRRHAPLDQSFSARFDVKKLFVVQIPIQPLGIEDIR
jgi:hypothetical protein